MCTQAEKQNQYTIKSINSFTVCSEYTGMKRENKGLMSYQMLTANFECNVRFPFDDIL